MTEITLAWWIWMGLLSTSITCSLTAVYLAPKYRYKKKFVINLPVRLAMCGIFLASAAGIAHIFT